MARRGCSSSAGNRVVQARVELGELALPADEDPACRLGNRLRQWRGVERRVLAENRLLELAELLAGLDAELLDERFARVLVRGERLGLPPGAIERKE